LMDVICIELLILMVVRRLMLKNLDACTMKWHR
jgi:hypothetical protein